MAMDKNTMKTVGLLVEASKLDTVYRDLHLRRARQLLSVTLDESAYRAIGSAEKEIEDLMWRSRSAVLQRDWGQAAELSAQMKDCADGKRRCATWPISERMCTRGTRSRSILFPGKHFGHQSEAKQPDLRHSWWISLHRSLN